MILGGAGGVTVGESGEKDEEEALADLLSLITSIGFRPEDGNGVTVEVLVLTFFDLSVFDVDMAQEFSSSSSSSNTSTSSSDSIDFVSLALDTVTVSDCDFGGCAEN